MGALVCALPMLALKQSRHAYALGLTASIAVSVVTALLLDLISGSDNQRLSIAIIEPAIEEAVRISFLLVLPFALLRTDTSMRAWLAFGIAFGGFELCLKWLDLAATWSDAPRDGYEVASPLVPFAMHVALTLGGLWLHRRGKGAASIWVTLLGIHAFHNWSVLRFDHASTIEVASLLGLARIVAYSAAILWLLRRDIVRQRG